MHRIVLLTVLATALFAQKAPKAPPKPPARTDEALRARITEFYQYHVSEDYRKAEKLVSEDSQDFYYAHNKPHYLTLKSQYRIPRPFYEGQGQRDLRAVFPWDRLRRASP